MPTNVVALIGNSSRQVGLAYMDLANPCLRLGQLCDNRLYSSTLSVVESLNQENLRILIPNSHQKQVLSRLLLEKYPDNVIKVIRSSFNESLGMENVEEYSSKDLNRKDLNFVYLARASASALLSYVAHSEGVVFMRNSLCVTLDGMSSQLRMDDTTVKDLELLRNKRTKKAEGSLFELLDSTVTRIGKRLLRQQLLCPPDTMEVTMRRHEAAKEFLQKLTETETVQNLLAKLHDMDMLSRFYCIRPIRYTTGMLKLEVDNAIRLREVLVVMPALCELLAPFESILCRQIRATVQASAQTFEAITKSIDDKVDPRSEYQSRGEAQMHEALFAIKPNVDGLLDVARCTYSHTLALINNLVGTYSVEYPTLNLCLAWTKKRGYHLKLQTRQRHKQKRSRTEQASSTTQASQQPVNSGETLPDLFTQRVAFRASVHCTTEELVSLNARCEQASKQILERTIVHIGNLRDSITKGLRSLYAVADDIALLDVLLAICNLALENEDFTFPEINTSGELKLKGARHPVMEQCMSSKAEFVPSSFDLSVAGPRMAIITGPNSSGKSTLLREVALITIMAQIGFPVPAAYANVPLVYQILTRIGTDDCLEGNCSTFSLEMSEVAHIFEKLKESSASKRSTLILVDELGRGTSVKEGVAIAWACAEALAMHQNCITLFVTHFPQLLQLAAQIPLYMKSLAFKVGIDEATSTIQHSHFLEPSSASDTSIEYGIFASEKVGLPMNVVQAARTLRKRFLWNKEQEQAKNQAQSTAPVLNPPRSVRDMLLKVKANRQTLSLAEKRDLLATIRKSVVAPAEGVEIGNIVQAQTEKLA